MNGKFVFSFLRVSVTIAYYLMICVALFILVTNVIELIKKDDGDKRYSSRMMGFEKGNKELPYTYSSDSLVRYQPVKDTYTVEIKAHSAAGYYTIVMRMLLTGIAIAVFWNFKRIFEQTRLDDPFQVHVIKRLKILAVLFVVTDLVKIMDYILFNSFVHRSITSPRFELLTEVGDGIITGLVIWVIAIIFQRGIALQEENALTV